MMRSPRVMFLGWVTASRDLAPNADRPSNYQTASPFRAAARMMTLRVVPLMAASARTSSVRHREWIVGCSLMVPDDFPGPRSARIGSVKRLSPGRSSGLWGAGFPTPKKTT
jgi:hypothetical protein